MEELDVLSYLNLSLQKNKCEGVKSSQITCRSGDQFDYRLVN